VPLRSGRIELNGDDLSHLKAHEITTRGVVQVPEGRRIFARLTTLENLKMGAYVVSDKAVVAQRIDQAFEMFPRLKERQGQVAGTLSGGEQQMLAMSRALMSDPKLLLMDEPSMGLAPLLVDQIFDKIKELHARGTTILLVEQNARKALQIADRGYVIETGRIVLSAPAAELRENESVQKAYLGID
jgi:branched-chain amino acid transport system ATP-binding protein